MELTIEQREDIATQLRVMFRELQSIKEELSSLRKGSSQKNTQSLSDIADSARLPIGRAAKVLGISRDTLRTHTDNGLIRCAWSRGNKRRMYAGSELKRYAGVK